MEDETEARPANIYVYLFLLEPGGYAVSSLRRGGVSEPMGRKKEANWPIRRGQCSVPSSHYILFREIGSLSRSRSLSGVRSRVPVQSSIPASTFDSQVNVPLSPCPFTFFAPPARLLILTPLKIPLRPRVESLGAGWIS